MEDYCPPKPVWLDEWLKPLISTVLWCRFKRHPRAVKWKQLSYSGLGQQRKKVGFLEPRSSEGRQCGGSTNGLMFGMYRKKTKTGND